MQGQFWWLRILGNMVSRGRSHGAAAVYKVVGVLRGRAVDATATDLPSWRTPRECRGS